MSLFNPYRGFLIHNGQIIMDEISETGYYEKKSPLKYIINKLKKEGKFSYKYDEEEEKILYFHKEVTNDIITLQFARKKDLKIRRPKEKCIEEGKEEDFPYIYIIVDLRTQIFLFEHDTDTFSSTSASENSFRKFINVYLEEYNYTIEFEKILDEGQFWYYIKQMEKINYVKLSLNSPNLFGGKFETNDFLKELRKLYNNKKFEFVLKNKEDTLENIVEEEMGDAVRYIENGGGSWITKGKTKENNPINKNSKNLVKKVVIDEIDNKNIILNELKKINKDLFEDDKK